MQVHTLAKHLLCAGSGDVRIKPIQFVLSSLILIQHAKIEICSGSLLLPGEEVIKQRGFPEELSLTLGLEGCTGVCHARRERVFWAEEPASTKALRPEITWYSFNGSEEGAELEMRQ